MSSPSPVFIAYLGADVSQSVERLGDVETGVSNPGRTRRFCPRL